MLDKNILFAFSFFFISDDATFNFRSLINHLVENDESFMLGIQLFGYRGRLCLAHLNFWRLRHRFPQDPQGAEGPETSQGNQ